MLAGSFERWFIVLLDSPQPGRVESLEHRVARKCAQGGNRPSTFGVHSLPLTARTLKAFTEPLEMPRQQRSFECYGQL